jgi:hypothetical protein
MILHPEVFAKAQAEIDRVVGFDLLPDFQDRISLPYVESVVKEVYRYGSRVLRLISCLRLCEVGTALSLSVRYACQLVENRWLIQSRSCTSSIDKR